MIHKIHKKAAGLTMRRTLITMAVFACISASHASDDAINEQGAAQQSSDSINAAPGIVTAPKTEQKEDHGSRFVTRAGTGKSEVVASAPVPSDVIPAIQVSTPLQSVESSIDEARRAGGVAMDPSLREINLPGLKKDDPLLKPWVLHTRNGVNEIVKLSGSLINRIATPFKRPMLIDPSDSVSKIIGSDVYYTPSGSQPIGLFIIDSENKAQTISLTVIPTSSIPGQNLMVKVEDLRAIEDLAPNAPKARNGAPIKEADYTNFMRSIMTQAVRGKIQGFSIVPLEGGVAMIGDLEVTPDLVFSGSTLDVYRYKINNRSIKTLDLSEPAFYRSGVKAVSFFPKLALDANESGYVFIAADKPSAGGM